MKIRNSLGLLTLFSAVLAFSGCQTTESASTEQTDSRVTVNFPNAENYTDFKDSLSGTERGREDYEYMLRRTISETATAVLKEGQRLTITFNDIDLAGDFLPSARTGYNIRVVKEIYAPRMNFHFVLADANGAVLKEGDRNLLDTSFMYNTDIIDRNQELFHDKSMIKNWIRRELAK